MRRIQSLCCLLIALATVPVDVSVAAGQSVSGRVIGPDGKGIAQAVVFVDEPATGAAKSASPPTATMDQIDKTFVPPVLPIEVGTWVRFPNSDQISHHVYSFSRTKSFELPLYRGEDAKPVLFDKPGVVKIGCNIHDWMSAIILVLPTPYYAMTDDDGRFTLKGLPPGSYNFVAWHEQSRQSIEDTAQRLQLGTVVPELVFRISLTDERTRPAMRGSRWDR